MTTYYIIYLIQTMMGNGTILMFCAYTEQIEVVRWFKFRKDILSKITVETYQANSLEEFLEHFELMFGFSHIDNDNEFELKMHYVGNKCAPLYKITELAEYATNMFMDDMKTVIPNVVQLSKYFRNSEIKSVFEKLVKNIWERLVNYNTYNVPRSSFLNEEAITVDFAIREGVEYYEDC